VIRKFRLIGMAVAFALSAAACSSGPSAPQHSAPAACKDFRTWFLGIGGNVTSGNKTSILANAVHEAPSGHLYRDLSTLQSNVQTATAAKGTALASGERLMTLESAQAVQTDCQSVNPG
jgi:hypothetical protein